VTRPININERWRVEPFIEFFNLFNRNNPGANYAVNITQIPATFDMNGAVNGVCNPNCVLLTSLKQLEIPEARWEISSAPAPRWEFRSPRSSVCA